MSGAMKFLLDTNVIIPLEPASHQDIEPASQTIWTFFKKATTYGQEIYISSDAKLDISRDRNSDRRTLRSNLLTKYTTICPPDILPQNLDNFCSAVLHSNDWVDNRCLAIVINNAVDYLVTEDKGIHAKARAIGVAEKVINVNAALSILNDLFDIPAELPPIVRQLKAHELNLQDEIFKSLRNDYQGFDTWVVKCQKEHRDCFVIQNAKGSYKGVAILKRKISPDDSAKALKICTFRVLEAHSGNKYGELLLKSIFCYAYSNNYSSAYLTVYEKYDQLISFLKLFGFNELGNKTELGEQIYEKLFMDGNNASSLTPLEYNIKYGPYAISPNTSQFFIVPIRPKYANILFPELNQNPSLFSPDTPPGNAIRKAYICCSKTRKIENGSVLFFYRSIDIKSIICCGIVEDRFVSNEPNRIASFVGARTVYTFDTICNLCQRQVLAMLFRQSFKMVSPVKYDTLIQNNILRSHPQSIVQIDLRAYQWLSQFQTI